jgi:hypothetical protein
MFKRLRGAEVTAWDQGRKLTATCEDPPEGLKDLLFSALAASFPERAGKDKKLRHRIDNTLSDSAAFYRMTDPAYIAAESRKKPSSISKAHKVYLHPAALPETIDFLNLQKRLWFYPAGVEIGCTQSFPEIYADAVRKAADSLIDILCCDMSNGSFLPEKAAAIIGNGGLSIVDENGVPQKPLRSDPLPFDEAIDFL